jgi:type IV pilus assembly protein PilP
MSRAGFRMMVAFGLVLLAAGCSDGTAPAVEVTAPKKIKVQPPKAGENTVAEESQTPAAESIFVYNPSGRRDPFLGLLAVKKPVGAQQAQPQTPLQEYELGQFRLTGVIRNASGPAAMVMAPGGKSYVVKKGVKIGKNGGTIIAIENNRIVVEERYYDFAGELRRDRQEIRFPNKAGDN